MSKFFQNLRKWDNWSFMNFIRWHRFFPLESDFWCYREVKFSYDFFSRYCEWDGRADNTTANLAFEILHNVHCDISVPFLVLLIQKKENDVKSTEKRRCNPRVHIQSSAAIESILIPSTQWNCVKFWLVIFPSVKIWSTVNLFYDRQWPNLALSIPDENINWA